MNLVNVHRGNIVESAHQGHIAVVDANGKLLYALGDPDAVVFARSSMKPIQAIPVVETGAADHYQFSDHDLALCCASHSSESIHTDRVLDILKRMGIEKEALQCGTHIPRSQETYQKLIVAGEELTPLYNNCSGKHTGMLATAKHMNEDLASYYLLTHPLQQRILETVSEMCDYLKEQIEIGIDGCGVPVHGLPLKNIAFGYAKMADTTKLSEKRAKMVTRITNAMMNAPEMVAGTNRFCTDFMRIGNGRFFGKVGAEGVYCLGDKETGLGIAVKIKDGNERAVYPATIHVLRELGLLSAEQLQALSDYRKPPLKNARGEKIGELVADFKLNKVV
ncbi:asparaginase [Bacillus sp. PS06]|uniref:asparaginase n=1 Tax=Bacillus sp. PS06 TaxID=2764176 RepID=UPI00177F9594|nr:asparaginase [Bacillus sp. PS06]MBD8070571.1 asparaginase [Bacillus sp. PS06]